MSGLVDGDHSDTIEQLARVSIFAHIRQLTILLEKYQDFKIIIFRSDGSYCVEIWYEEIASANGKSNVSMDDAIGRALSKIPKGWLK